MLASKIQELTGLNGGVEILSIRNFYFDNRNNIYDRCSINNDFKREKSLFIFLL